MSSMSKISLIQGIQILKRVCEPRHVNTLNQIFKHADWVKTKVSPLQGSTITSHQTKKVAPGGYVYTEALLDTLDHEILADAVQDAIFYMPASCELMSIFRLGPGDRIPRQVTPINTFMVLGGKLNFRHLDLDNKVTHSVMVESGDCMIRRGDVLKEQQLEIVTEDAKQSSHDISGLLSNQLNESGTADKRLGGDNEIIVQTHQGQKIRVERGEDASERGDVREHEGGRIKEQSHGTKKGRGDSSDVVQRVNRKSAGENTAWRYIVTFVAEADAVWPGDPGWDPEFVEK